MAACAANLGCGGVVEADGGGVGPPDGTPGGGDESLGGREADGARFGGSGSNDGGNGSGDDADTGAIGDAGDSGDVSVEAADACMSCFCGLPIPEPPPLRTPYQCPTPDGSTDATIDEGGTAAAPAACLGEAGPDRCLAMGCSSSYGAHYIESIGFVSGGSLLSCGVILDDAGATVLECRYPGLNCGRRTSSFRLKRPWSACNPVAAHLASSALLESISVDAFQILAAELHAHGAPARLIRAAQRAAREEARHTRETAALAKRFGATPAVTSLLRHPVRSVEAIALENAVEGCVRETYGALLATHQARAAADPAVRATMARIALDETRHAALAWDIAEWALSRLNARARRRVERARAQAIRDLGAELAQEPDATVAHLLGVPCAAAAKAMLNTLEAAVWVAAA